MEVERNIIERVEEKRLGWYGQLIKREAVLWPPKYGTIYLTENRKSGRLRKKQGAN